MPKKSKKAKNESVSPSKKKKAKKNSMYDIEVTSIEGETMTLREAVGDAKAILIVNVASK